MMISFYKQNWVLVALLFCFNVQFAHSQDRPASPVTSLREFRADGTEVIGRQVDLEATVTYVEPVWNWAFVQDGEDAAFIYDVDAKDLQFGDRVRVVGVGKRGDVGPVIQGGQLSAVQSDLPPPAPMATKISNLKMGDLDGCYISVEGVIKRAVSGVGHTLLFCEEAGVEFHVSSVGGKTAEELWSMIGSRMKFSGALGVTVEPGTEKLKLGRNVTMFRILSSQEPAVISKAEVGLLPRRGSNAETEDFLLTGHITMELGDYLILAHNKKSTRIEFPEVQGFDVSQISRVAGKRTTDKSGNTIYDALVIETLFSTPLPFTREFQSIVPKDRLWRFVKVYGRPENIRMQDDRIVFEINREGQNARVEFDKQVATNIELLKNTRRLEVTGTVVACDEQGNCTVVVPNSEHVLLRESIIPIWKYIAWGLLPITAMFSIGFLWVKHQRNQADFQAKEIGEMHTRLVSTYSAISDGLLAVDNDNRVLAVNPEFCKLFGRELLVSETITPDTCLDFFARIEDCRLVQDIIFKSHPNREQIGIEFEVFDSKRMTYNLRVSGIVAENGTPIGRLLLLQDRTRERELQTELIHSNKMEAVGQLVGGIAHDFNNVLTTIMANLSLISLASASDQKTQDRIADAEMATNRGADLVRRLLTYSGKTELKPHPHSINQIIRDLHRFARATFDARYEFDFDLDARDPIVFVDSAAIEQVVLNLYLNSRDAMPDGGKISVKTRLKSGSKNPMACVWIFDTGTGISKSDRDRVFEPFFTTKAGEAGTGLGLYTSKRVIRDQHGELRCRSSPEKGTCFLIRLPSTNAAAKVESPENADVETTASENKTVLIVDDEDAIRHTCKLILESQNFGVLTASNGEAALDLLRSDQHQIDMVLLDLTMPGISGLEVLEIASVEFPHLPVVLCSGYLAGVLDSLEDGSLTLPKPFSAAKLLDTVSKALARETVTALAKSIKG